MSDRDEGLYDLYSTPLERMRAAVRIAAAAPRDYYTYADGSNSVYNTTITGGAPSTVTAAVQALAAQVIPLPEDLPVYRVASRPSVSEMSPSRLVQISPASPDPTRDVVNPDRAQAAAGAAAVGLAPIAKMLAQYLAVNAIAAQFSGTAKAGNILGGDSVSVHPTIIAMRLIGRSFAFSGDAIQVSDFTLGGQSFGRRTIERLKSVLTLGQQVPEYLEGLGLNDNAAELVEALLVDFDSMLADGAIMVPEPRRGGETRSALYEQLNFLHFNLNNGNAWLTDNPYGNGGGKRRGR